MGVTNFTNNIWICNPSIFTIVSSWTAQDISEYVKFLGNAYAQYATYIVDNGMNGDCILANMAHIEEYAATIDAVTVLTVAILGSP